jgi:hypothetical protein
MIRRALYALPLATLLATACGGNDGAVGGSGGSAADAGTVAGLVSIQPSQTDVHIPAGAMTAFAVTATFNDGTRSDVTQQADARSSDENVVALTKGPGSQIQIAARSPGTARILVTYGGQQSTITVTVSAR